MLYGAKAISLAVNRRAHCVLTVRDEGAWQLQSVPTFWSETVSLKELRSQKSTDTLTSTVNWFSRRSALPEHVFVQMNTTGFFSKQGKLGLGSSAGVMVTLYAALATLVNRTMNTQDLLDLYRATGNNGSAIDVLTSYFGGLIKFESQSASPVNLPDGIYLDIYALGFSTETAIMVDHFRQEFDDLPVTLQQNFIGAASTVADSLTDNLTFFVALEHYIQVYRDLASEANLSVWSALHETMYRLASEVGALYKPSGAGGGDIGVAIATEPQCLTALRHKMTALPVTLLDLQKDNNGVRIEQAT